MNRLQQLRKNAGMTQAELSAVLKVKPAAVSKYETGRTELTERNIKCLCSFYQVSADYLLGLDDLKENDVPCKEESEENPTNGGDDDFYKNMNTCAQRADNLAEGLEKQVRDLAAQFLRTQRYLDHFVCRLYKEGVPTETLSRAMGCGEADIKKIIHEKCS